MKSIDIWLSLHADQTEDREDLYVHFQIEIDPPCLMLFVFFFHQLTAGIRAQNAESLYRRFLSREKRQFCLLMKYGGSFIRLCWRLPWHLIPLASMLSVWFGVFSKSYQVFLTLEEKTRPSGECEILFEDPLRTSLSNKTKQGASVVTNRIAFFKDESLWFSHEV